MVILELISEKWLLLCEKVGPVFGKIGFVLAKIRDVLMLIWTYIVKLRKIFLTIPVAWAAVMLALRNLRELPEMVGLDLQIDGTFAIQMNRELAVLGPVAITAFCLLLMFCSRRVMTPWVVSLVSLMLPLFIWLINVFPS